MKTLLLAASLAFASAPTVAGVLSFAHNPPTCDGGLTYASGVWTFACNGGTCGTGSCLPTQYGNPDGLNRIPTACMCNGQIVVTCASLAWYNAGGDVPTWDLPGCANPGTNCATGKTCKNIAAPPIGDPPYPAWDPCDCK